MADTIAAPVKKPMPVLSFPAVQLLGITVRDLISSSEHQAQGMQLVAQRVDRRRGGEPDGPVGGGRVLRV